MRAAILALALILVLVAAPTYAQQDGPQAIGYGQTVSGELTTQRPETLYSFGAQQGDVITVTMDAVDGNVDPMVILVDQSQQMVLAVDNDSGGNHNARLRFVIPTSAIYIVRATTVQGSGDIKGTYKLTLSLDNPTPTPAATVSAPLIASLQPGESVQGDLGDAVRFHVYSLRAIQGDPITASLALDGANLQAGLYLYTADFRELGRAELGEPLNVKAPADGLYFLIVARSGGAGVFTLRQGTADGTSGASIPLGRNIQGKITTDNAVKTYSLQGKSGQIIVCRMRRLSGDLAVYLSVVALDSGQTLAEASGENGIAELSTVLPADGTYAVVATREGKQAGTTTGDFALLVAPPGEAAPLPPNFQGHTPLQYGDKVSGSLDDKQYARPYVFSAEAGDVIEATMSAPDGDLQPYLLLQESTGNTIAENGGSPGKPGARVQATLARAGYYALIATRDGFDKGKTSGKYDLGLTILDPSQAGGSARANGVALIAGQAQPGAIGPQFANLYRFEAQANTVVSVDVSPAPGLEVVTLLGDSAFQEIARATTGPIRGTLLARAGTYYVLVVRRGGPNDPSIGSYTIMLQGTVNPAPTAAPVVLTVGQPVSGTITPENYQIRYLVDAKQGTSLIVTMDAVPGTALDPMVAVLDEKNNLLLLNDNAAKGTANAALIYDVSRDGQYVILATRAGEAVGTTAGAYTLKVEVRQTAAAPTMTPTPAAQSQDIVPIRYGSTLNGVIGPQRFLYYYSFQGNVGDVITIRLSRVPGNQLDPLLYLYAYGAQPVLIAGNNDIAPGNPDAAIVKFKLPQTGLYLIAATRVGVAQGPTAGSFILTLNKDE
jgi:hypothetical protein